VKELFFVKMLDIFESFFPLGVPKLSDLTNFRAYKLITTY